ncbi:hypothetical protein WDV06_27255 [Streptomyces racemochromogenes]|uniref:Small hydrophilic protein n=1 Tax=Streptomyces racemochromogenes TaxID=67353 RepID=A0ABW7PK15_9ACTN
MSDDAQQRKERADRLREMIRRPGSKHASPERESLHEGVERRMRELDEAEREQCGKRPDDRVRPASEGEEGEGGEA